MTGSATRWARRVAFSSDRMLIADPFLHWAGRNPAKTAVVFGNESVSYAELRARATRVAMRVQAEQQLPTMPPCAIMLTHGIDFTTVFLGVTMAGAAAMILDAKGNETALTNILAAHPSALLFIEPAQAGMAPALGAPLRTICVGDGAPIDLPRPADALATIPCAASPDAPFYIGHTSGTTGDPKPFIRSHRSWLASLDAAAVEFPVDADDHVLVPGQPSQSLFLYALVETLSFGATAYLLPRFDAGAVVTALRRRPITRIHGVPTMYAGICEAAAEARFPAVGALLSGGAKLAPALRSRLAQVFPHATISEYYGASELSFVTVAQGDCPADSVGRPFHGVRISIRRDDGSEVSPGEIGRLYVRSAMICTGLLVSSDNSGFRMRDGWATVGDLAWRDGRGRVYLAGREGGMIISGGLNIYPAEVEAVLHELPEVAEAAVFGIPDPYWGEKVCAVMRWTDGATLTRDALRARCRQRLDRRKCPQQYFATERFDYTQSGKIAVAALRNELLRGKARLAEIA